MKITVAALPDANDPDGLEGVIAEIRSAADPGFSRVWLPQCRRPRARRAGTP